MSDGQFREEKAIAQWLKTLCRLLYNTFVIAIRCYNNYWIVLYIPESSRPKSMEKKFAVDIFETS